MNNINLERIAIMISYDLFAHGKRFALTVSFDDGRFDDRLIEILNRYGIKGTFHLNSGNMKRLGLYDSIGQTYQGHEVSCHGTHHSTMQYIPTQGLVEEIFEDRRALEAQMGYPVTGLSYACGGYTQIHKELLRGMGIEYSRTTKNGLNGFQIPEDFLEWHPTCHYKSCMETGKQFLSMINRLKETGWLGFPSILYVWGHAHELENNGHWDMIEEFCRLMGGNDMIWYATNIEICRYIKAQRSLIISADESIVYNPTAIDVWFSKNGKEYYIRGGETLRI